MVTKRKMIIPLVFVLVALSLLRVLKLTVSSSSFSSHRIAINTFNYESSKAAPKVPLNPIKKLLPRKEIRFLFNIISKKSPCNVLFFGLEEEYLKVHNINRGGTTVFLENRPEILKKTKGVLNATRVYKIEYKTYAKDAYKLLKYERSHSSCFVSLGIETIMSKCKLALTGLPKEVVTTKWDVIVVDGPGGDGLESPGRMGSIFTAGALARAGNETNVVVHDVDRMIEKWFSWEFLCEENRVSSKGRFWNFRIPQQNDNNSRRFCFV
ncbi:arabinogalactan O-methyltransferase 2-like [Rutidosis leptorrhynchoides]|uniref:arabinogalactan O-methyltransferase 2-like n=1 Tax=Rutidosis leptorrhynchoides TaxID=125765 RepID=UPI003A98EBFC